jgi:hypothetical protein
MSYGTVAKGTVEEVKAKLTVDSDDWLKSYPPGTSEGEDIVATKARAFAHLDAMDLTPQAHYDGDLVNVEWSGSHSWSNDKERPLYTNIVLRVGRVQK